MSSCLDDPGLSIGIKLNLGLLLVPGLATLLPFLAEGSVVAPSELVGAGLAPSECCVVLLLLDVVSIVDELVRFIGDGVAIFSL